MKNLAPFNCHPEILAQSQMFLLKLVSLEDDKLYSILIFCSDKLDVYVITAAFRWDNHFQWMIFFNHNPKSFKNEGGIETLHPKITIKACKMTLLTLHWCVFFYIYSDWLNRIPIPHWILKMWISHAGPVPLYGYMQSNWRYNSTYCKVSQP